MKNIYSNIRKVNTKILSKAVNHLKRNDLIGVPTETVYGLAGNAYSRNSVKKIYSLKKRPKFNPLIIHYLNKDQIANDVILNNNFFRIYKNLCPGPITFILKKKISSKVTSLATANLKTIAIRFPKNKMIRKLLKEINFPLAIPSANKSGGISPVEPKDVAEEFGGKVKLIIDDGKTKIGLESTVIDLTGRAKILRPGSISAEKISKILRSKVLTERKFKNIKSPGSIKKHYSPGIPMLLNQKIVNKNFAFIAFGSKYKNDKNIFNLSKESDLDEAAKNLYRIFRIIKNKNYKKIYVAKIPNRGIGIAINDRLNHAAKF